MTDCESWKRMTQDIPSLAEERWSVKRILGYTLIFYIPRHHFKRWNLLAVFRVHRDALTYLNTL